MGTRIRGAQAMIKHPNHTVTDVSAGSSSVDLPAIDVREPNLWTIDREIGTRTGRGPERLGGILHYPVAIKLAHGRNLLVLDEIGDSRKAYLLNRRQLTSFEVRNAPHTPIWDAVYAGADRILAIIGIQSLRIVYLDLSGNITQVVWQDGRGYPLNAPNCIMQAMDKIVVGDNSKSGRRAAIYILDKAGGLMRKWRSIETGRLGEVGNLTVLPDGGIIATDYGLHQVLCVEPSGAGVRWRYGKPGVPGRRSGELAVPSSTTITSRNTILIADTRNGRLVEVSRTGQFIRHHFGETDQLGALSSPIRDPTGVVQVGDTLFICDASNSRIVSFRRGCLFTEAGRIEPRNSVLSYPRSVQALGSGQYLIADTNNSRVIKMTKENKIKWQFGNGEPHGMAQLLWPRCAWVDRFGRIFIADSLGRRILLVDADGRILREINRITWSGRTLELLDVHECRPTNRGTLLVADAQRPLVAETTETGEVLWGINSSAGIRDPHQVLELSSGRLVVIDSGVGLLELELDDQRRRVIWMTFVERMGQILIQQPKAALEMQGRLMIACSKYSGLDVLYPSREGRGLAKVKLENSVSDPESGRFSSPRWLCSDESGTVVVSDHDAHRLLRIRPVSLHSSGGVHSFQETNSTTA